MTSQIAIDMTGILQMAFVACLVACLLPLGPKWSKAAGSARNWRTETKSGLVRAACGVVVAVGSWSAIQLVGGAIEGPRQVAQMQVPIVVLPGPQQSPYGAKPGVPGHDI